jgi:hypothetical protein
VAWESLLVRNAACTALVSNCTGTAHLTAEVRLAWVGLIYNNNIFRISVLSSAEKIEKPRIANVPFREESKNR